MRQDTCFGHGDTASGPLATKDPGGRGSSSSRSFGWHASPYAPNQIGGIIRAYTLMPSASRVTSATNVHLGYATQTFGGLHD